MKKRVEINGDALRREREKRALTQEELSERTRLGVRTLRRLEAGHGTLETIKRVNEALAGEPHVSYEQRPKAEDPLEVSRVALRFDLLIFEVSSSLIPLVEAEAPLWERMKAIRRHIAFELGFAVPPIRFCDNLQIPAGTYRIKVRELVVGSGTVELGRFLAVGAVDRLEELGGPRIAEPSYGMPAVWIDPSEQKRAERLGCMVFDPTRVVATHLTSVIRSHAHRLLGVDETQDLLDGLDRPVAQAELLARHSLTTLRAVLRELLSESVSIRDLGLIVETLLDEPVGDTASLVEAARRALAPQICQEIANRERQIVGIELACERELPRRTVPVLSARLEELSAQGLLAIVVTAPELRRRVREALGPPRGTVVLSRAEIASGYELRPVSTVSLT